MKYGRRRVAVLLLVLSAMAGTVTATAGAVGGETAHVAATAGEGDADAPTILVTRSLRQVEGAGRVGATVTYELPPGITRFETTLPAVADGRATVADTEGFERTGDGELRWDGETRPAHVELSMTVAAERLGVGEVSVDTGSWALVRPPEVTGRWRYTGAEPTYDERTVVDGEGVAGDALAFLGEATVTTHRADGVRFRLVTPAASDPVSPAERTLDTLAGADAVLGDVGGTGTVTAFVMPDGDVTTAAGGTALRGSFWVDASQPARWGGHNLWRHELVHTRQAYRTDASMAWFDEASACYFSRLLGLYAGDASFESFHAGVASATAEGTLTDRASWSGPMVEYTRGCRVLAALDARLHASTGGERGVDDVLARMNDHDGVVTYPVFRALVSEVAGEPMAGWLDAHVDGDARAAVPADPDLFARAETGADSDDDGLPDRVEGRLATDPFDPDSDDDGIPDGDEAGATLQSAGALGSAEPTRATAADADRVMLSLETVDRPGRGLPRDPSPTPGRDLTRPLRSGSFLPGEVLEHPLVRALSRVPTLGGILGPVPA